jgi:hypothetical protein
MSQRYAIGALATLLALVIAACRGHQPSEDPKSAPNSPLPTIDRPDDPHAAPDQSPDAG